MLQGGEDHPRETARIEITQGPAGAKNAVYVQVSESRLCMGRSRLVSADEDEVVYGESDVTTSVPAARCTPAAHQTLALRSPDVLEWTSGAAKATFRKSPTGTSVVPARLLGEWRNVPRPEVYGDQDGRYGSWVTVTQGPVGTRVVRFRDVFPRTDEDGAPTPETISCGSTAVLGGTGNLLVIGPQVRDPAAWDSECAENGSSYLQLVKWKGEDRLLVYPMVDAEPGEYQRRS
ncbi:hypothetical protein [Streptomyces sp. S1]|uniref:hypothetical protein n=1 Tax=Streptomyces sp. S1 TaxID=718288 RepID=UPI003D735FEA